MAIFTFSDPQFSESHFSCSGMPKPTSNMSGWTRLIYSTTCEFSASPGVLLKYPCWVPATNNPGNFSFKCSTAFSAAPGGFPKLLISGTQHGYFNKNPGDIENSNVVEIINRAQPDILLVGFGMPLQEKWLSENRESLNVKIAITCGALFEYLSGDLKRGPRWMTEHYLEWLARMIISPRRYYKRYLRDNPIFLFRIIKQKFLGIY